MIYLGFGSNIGDRLLNIHKAYDYLTYIGEIIKKSPVYENSALLYNPNDSPQPDYLNSVVSFLTPLNPYSLLFEIKEIEKYIGPRSLKKWGERTIDIDILLYNDLILNEENLKIPHQEIANRIFVLKPLYDIAGNIIIFNYYEKKYVNILTLLKNFNINQLRLYAKE